MTDDNKKNISTVLNEQTDYFLSINGVFGVAEGKTEDGTDIILLQVEKLTDEIKKIPKIIDGYSISITEMGRPTLEE